MAFCASLQDPVAIRLRQGALYGLPMALVTAGWAGCYASSAAGLVAAMHGASLSTKACLLSTALKILKLPLLADRASFNNPSQCVVLQAGQAGHHYVIRIPGHRRAGQLISLCLFVTSTQETCACLQVTFAALWGLHHMMHMLWGKLVVSMGPSLVSTSMGAAVAALNFGLNFAFSQVGSFMASMMARALQYSLITCTKPSCLGQAANPENSTLRIWHGSICMPTKPLWRQQNY